MHDATANCKSPFFLDFGLFDHPSRLNLGASLASAAISSIRVIVKSCLSHHYQTKGGDCNEPSCANLHTNDPL